MTNDFDVSTDKLRAFYETLLPRSGVYCVTTITREKIATNHFVGSVSELTSLVRRKMGDYNVFVSPNSFHSSKSRKAENAAFAKSFYLDLDVGDGKSYETRRAAEVALAEFCDRFKFPEPLRVNSGQGLHAYWILSEEIAVEKWKPLAKKLKALCLSAGLGIDTNVTADAARVLRAPFTLNLKVSPPLPTHTYASNSAASIRFHAFSALVEAAATHVSRPSSQDDTNAAAELQDEILSRLKELSKSGVDADTKAVAESNSFQQSPENIYRIRSALDAQILSGQQPDYAEWSKYMLMLKSLVTLEGWDETVVWQIFDEWSAHCGGNYHADNNRRQWDACKSRPENPLTFRTLLHHFPDSSRGSGIQPSAGIGGVGAGDPWAGESGYMTLSATAPPAREYLLAGTAVSGTAIVLAGLGGTAKTIASMQICVNSALGKNLGAVTIAEGCSLLILGEEAKPERDRRFGALCKDLSPSDRDIVRQRIRCMPAAGVDVRLTSMTAGNLAETSMADRIVALGREHSERCGSPLRFLVLDHIRLLMTGDSSADTDVTQVTRVLAKIALELNCCVIVIAHSPKAARGATESSDAREVFGSSAFVDNTRGAFVLSTMRPDEAKKFDITSDDAKNYVRLACVKANYGPSDGEWWFKKVSIPDWGTAKLEPVNLFKASSFPNYSALQTRIIGVIRNSPRPVTERNLRDMAGMAGPLKASDAEVRRTIGRILGEGIVVRRDITPQERSQHRLSSNAKVAIDLPTVG